MTQPKEKPRNIIWIFGDQHRSQALSCHGDPNIHTPNIDRMAHEGVDCRGCVSGFPLCCPARGTLLTGRYPHHAVAGHEEPLDPTLPTIADPFNNAGYHTAYFGKWHLDGFHERTGRSAMHIIPPERRGRFQQWEGYENNNSQWDCWIHGGEGGNAFHEKLEGYETDALTDRMLYYLDERLSSNEDGQPFFSVLSVQPPHDPYVAPEQWMKNHSHANVKLRDNVPPIPRIVEQARTEVAGYAAMVENLDFHVGRIMQKLEEYDAVKDTVILFFSDHGDQLGSHGHFRKHSPYEESTRVPLIIWGGTPMYGARRGTNYEPVSLVDLAQTSLGICGIEAPDSMEGHDYSWLWDKKQSRPDDAPDSAYLQVVNPTGHGNSMDRPYRGIVTADGWKYVCLEGQPWMLFNLNEDPLELANHAQRPETGAIRAKLNKRLQKWIDDTGDSFILPEVK
ncbi:sulfatase [Rubellicoccus peritrichatus]|uniref:Sulfatase n=1 Tax=Rubellicoccus peritrichatus TaxID=3080537 RepID=A0AAQ3QPP9_9BACT|nr:sulfatase [Puniceicoccus sp. CR14]WOO39293.1 sulfatase [Puniceicoccus sp. CR14]